MFKEWEVFLYVFDSKDDNLEQPLVILGIWDMLSKNGGDDIDILVNECVLEWVELLVGDFGPNSLRDEDGLFGVDEGYFGDQIWVCIVDFRWTVDRWLTL